MFMCCKNNSSVINGQQLFSYTLHILSLYRNGGVRTVDFRIMSRVFYRCATKNHRWRLTGKASSRKGRYIDTNGRCFV